MATLTACAGSCPTAPPLAWPRRILAQSQPKNTKSRRSKRRLLDRAPTYAPPTWQSRSRYRFAPSQAHLSSWPNPHRSRGTAAAHIPRFRALALFGRRALERVDSPAIPASENLHRKRHLGAVHSNCRDENHWRVSHLPQATGSSAIEVRINANGSRELAKAPPAPPTPQDGLDKIFEMHMR